MYTIKSLNDNTRPNNHYIVTHDGKAICEACEMPNDPHALRHINELETVCSFDAGVGCRAVILYDCDFDNYFVVFDSDTFNWQ